MILRLIDETYRVAWSDFCYLRNNFATIMLTVLIMPLLYFVTFAFGLGNYVDEIDGVSYVAFVIPGIVSLSTVTSCFSSTANKIMVQRRFYSSFDEILLCPISPSAVVLGKTTVGFIKGMICSIALMLLGVFMTGDMHITVLLVLLMALSCMVFSLLGVLAGFIVKGLPTMNLFNSLVILPMTFLSGTLFSISAYPPLAQTIVNVLPLTHTTSCIRAAALGWDIPYLSLIVLVAYGILFFILAYYLLVKGKV